MLLDTQNLFSDNQQISKGTSNSDNIVYFGKGDVSFVPLIIQVVEDFSGLTSLKVEVQTSEDSAFSDASILCESSLTLENLKAGDRFPISYLPKGNKGYIRLVYTTTTEASSTDEIAGRITAGVVASDEQNIL